MKQYYPSQFEMDRQIKLLDQLMLEKDEYLQKLYESHSNLLEALKDCSNMSLFETPKWDATIANAEKLK